MPEQTLIIIKPDGIQRRLAGRIISRFERKGFELAAAKFLTITKDLAKQLYAVHKNKPFFGSLIKYLCSGPCLVMVWRGEGVIVTSRKLIGATSGYDARAGTIRGDFCCSGRYNLVHGSDSPATAEQEIPLFFTADEILEYETDNARWLYGPND